MRTLRAWLARLGGLFNKQRRDRELADELESHLRFHIEDNLVAGMTAEEARRQALVRLGGMEQTKEEYRDQRGVPMLRIFWYGIRLSFRTLRKNPGFAAVAILTLALGIGANTAMFSVVYAALLAPLPYPHPDQLVMVWSQVNGHRNTVSTADFLDWQRESSAFQGLVAWSGGLFSLSSSGHPEVLQARIVSPNFFSMQGIPIALGRGFLSEEGVQGNEHVVILTHRLWQTRFGGDPAIVGEQIRLNSESYTVDGVLAAGMSDRFESQIFMPLAFAPQQMTRDYRWLSVMGRLKPNVTTAQANDDMDSVARRIADAYPAADRGWSVHVEPLKNDYTSQDTIKDFWLLLGAVGFLLLIACANVANLLLARSTIRRKEVAIRSALGATRAQLFVQFLAENLSLSFLGGAFGIGLAWALLQAIVALLPPYSIPTEADVSVNLTVLLFSITATLLAGVLCGCAPAWQSSHRGPGEVLKEGGRSSSTVGRHGVRRALVVTEFALALALLSGAALVLHSFWKLTRADLGFREDHILTFRLPVTSTRFSNADQITAFYRQLLEKIDATPGVSSAAVATGMPILGDFGSKSFSVVGHSFEAARPSTGFSMVTPDYFRTFGIQITQGRAFTEQDLAGGDRVVAVNETLARRYFANADPLQQRLIIQPSLPGSVPGTRILGDAVEWRVAGVFRDVKSSDPASVQAPEVLVPFWQNPWPSAQIALRTSGNPTDVTNSVAAIVQSVDPDMGLDAVRTMDQVVDQSRSGYRFATVLFAGFAGVALMLAAIGIYGVMSFAVSQRTNEIGLRMALGAVPQQVLLLVLREGIALALVGLAIGLAGAYAVGRLMESTLYQVTATDPMAIGAVAGVLLLSAVAASLVPARRAMRVDPMVALRHE
jgi:putative ABC transport system permease protein